MTVTSALWGFSLLAGALTLVPGLDTALVLRAALADGRRTAFATGAGISSGSLTWGAASAVGVSALLTASQTAFAVLRLAGAAYLVWTGARLVLSSRHPSSGPDPAGEGPGRLAGPAPAIRASTDAGPVGQKGASGNEMGSIVRAWRQGFATNLLNPKVGVFYVMTIPQFLPPGTPHLAMGLALAAVHALEGMSWFAVLILAAGRVRRHLGGDRFRRAADAVTGTVLVAFGLRLAATP